MKTTSTETIIRDSVDTDALASYLTAPWGHKLAVYADGTVGVGESVGDEIDPDERPVAIVRCPGIGNLDMTYWRAGWECADLTDEEVIRDCCANGNVADELDNLQAELIEDATS